MPFRFSPLGFVGSILEVLAGAFVLHWTSEGYSTGFTVMLLMAGIALISVGTIGMVAAARRTSVSKDRPNRDTHSA